MKYLMYCGSDHSYSVVNKTDLIYDATQQLKIGQKLFFFWGNEQFEGEIKLISDDGDYLQNEAIRQKRDLKQPSSSKNESPLEKRQPIKKKIFTPGVDQKEAKKKRKLDNSKQETRKLTSLSAEICQRKTRSLVINTKKNKSPAKEMDTKNLEKTTHYKKRLELHYPSSTEDDEDNENKKSSEDESTAESYHEGDKGEVNEKESSDEEDKLCIDEKESSDDEDHVTINEKESDNKENEKINKTNEDDSKQYDKKQDHTTGVKLIGQSPTEPMVELKNGVMCVEKVLDTALEVCKEGTHLARRLIDGVFTIQHLLRATYSGQPPHAQGKDRMNEPVECLDRIGKQAIKDYTVKWCKDNRKKIPTEGEFKKAMTQRIGEIKRRERENKKFFKRDENEDEM